MSQDSIEPYQLHHASIIVANTDLALAFYHDLLGFSLAKSRPDLGFPGAWLQVGTLQIHLLEVENPDQHSIRPEHGGRDHHLAFTVADIVSLQQTLKNTGVSYKMSRSGRQALFCRDPDGNALEFIQLQDHP